MNKTLKWFKNFVWVVFVHTPVMLLLVLMVLTVFFFIGVPYQIITGKDLHREVLEELANEY